MAAREEELVEMLQRSFKLTRYEARLYLALLKGASNPKEASSMSGVPLPRIYDVVRVLESKGFVVPSESWYRPLPPRAVAVAEIARIEGEARSRIKQVMGIAEELERMSALPGMGFEVLVLEGLYSILSAAAEGLMKSSNLLVIVFEALKGSEDRLLALLRDAVAKGVRTMLVYSGDPSGFTLPGDLEEVVVKHSDRWMPDAIVTDKVVILVVPDRRVGGLKGLAVKDEVYAGTVLRAVLQQL